jgi:hypothetical protein
LEYIIVGVRLVQAFQELETKEFVMRYVEVKYQPERSRACLGSPSLVKLDDGELVATHDYWGIYTLEGDCGLSSVYRSEDEGATWENVTHIIGAQWGTLVKLPDALYHISSTREYGDMVIRRSTDGGFTWSLPRDEKTGLLMRNESREGGTRYRFECGGGTLVHGGYLYKSYDKYAFDPGESAWEAGNFGTGIGRVPLDKDPLDVSNWTFSNILTFDASKLTDPKLSLGNGTGWLEGNPLPTPDGKIASVMRIHVAKPNMAAYLTLSDDAKVFSFDYETGLIDFIGGHSRFYVQLDPVTGLYVTFSNFITDGPVPTNRNLLSLAVSEDLRHWRRVKDVMRDESGLPPALSRQLTGFQYPAWQFDGDDIILLCRMGYRGSVNFHDSNRITFHRFKGWRSWL